MASSSSSSSHSWKYDVFLSFRGEDTRKTFVDHLYTALVQKGIYTYKDDETLDRGESIGPSLIKAIKESQIAVVIFSENYADSSWCLDELVYIMKCREEGGQIVIPIFYHVDPSEVRKVTRKYGKIFAKHESENKKKIESWRKALVDASNISGWEPKHISGGHEANCIKEIVDTISHRLRQVISADENLIGIEGRMKDVISKLKVRGYGVVMVGLWGVGGGGKTTLASSLYNKISSSFDGCCFVDNIREKSSKKGLEELQKTILHRVLEQKELKVDRVEEGSQMIKSRLCHRKVLIVLDDVDHHDHLIALAGSHDWFGEGSRIIITTRDKHILKAHKVNVIHDVSLLNDEEAIRLFHKHAHRDYRPREDYELLSKEVVSYANGLPLALIVLGSYLCGRKLNEWKSALARLKKIPNNNILGKLKISFDGLEPDEKKMFLDIACFFKGQRECDAKEIFDGCGFYSEIGIRVLIEKALITNFDGRIDMHDLVQEMGHHIVGGEHPKNPEKHTRVWEGEDVLKIFDVDATMELDKIEAIRFVDCEYYPLPRHHPQVIAKMNKLRWIDWKGRSGSSLPVNFPPKELCCLILRNYVLRQVWVDYKYLPNLRMIKLYDLRGLIETPDFVGLPNLERFILEGSPELEEIHPSIGRLERLVCLIIRYCDNLERIPPITRSQKLDTIDISYCPKVWHASPCSFCQNKNTNISIFLRIKIHYHCHNHIGSLFFHRALTKLNLSDCNLDDRHIDNDSVVWELSSLIELHIGSNNFSRLNFGLWQLPRLKWLNVSCCKNLVELLGVPSSIAVLEAHSCDSLESIGDISNCKWLWRVSLYGVNKLGPLGCYNVLDSMLFHGNAIEDHFTSFTITGNQIPERFVNKVVKAKTFILELPHNWYNDFSGFLICCHITHAPRVTITIQEGLHTDYQSDEEIGSVFSFFHLLSHLRPDDTYVGYVSFNSLMSHAQLLNSEYNTISISTAFETRLAAKLVPRKTKYDPVQKTKAVTDSSEFYNEGHEYGKTFTIQHHSKSFIKILWNPRY